MLNTQTVSMLKQTYKHTLKSFKTHTNYIVERNFKYLIYCKNHLKEQRLWWYSVYSACKYGYINKQANTYYVVEKNLQTPTPTTNTFSTFNNSIVSLAYLQHGGMTDSFKEDCCYVWIYL